MSILSKIFALCLSVFYTFNPFVSPSDQTPITAQDSDCKLRFIAWADPQISNYMLKRDPFFKAACEDVANSTETFDALLMAGDIAENGLACEYAHIAQSLPTDNIKNFIMCIGNHDIRLRSYKQVVRRFTGFMNGLNTACGSELRVDSLSYKYTVNGYTFIVLGTDRTEFEESYISPAQMQWLDDSLKEATANGLPAFVVVHQSLKDTHGLPDTWNSPFDAAGSIGKQSDELKATMSKYDNVFLITGHLHTGFGQYTYEYIDGIHSINLPSLTINNMDGNRNDNGLGCVVEVTSKSVIFHARNFATGENIPEEDIAITLK